MIIIDPVDNPRLYDLIVDDRHVKLIPSVPKAPTIKAATIRVLYAVLFIYAGIAGTYQVVNAISTAIGFFNLRNQVQAPFPLYGNLISVRRRRPRMPGLL